MTDPQGAPVFNAPSAVKWIAGVTFLAHVLRVMMPDRLGLLLLFDMAFIPSLYVGEASASFGEKVLLFTSPLTYMLAHIDFTHLLVNVLLFLGFGSGVGRVMGFWQMVLLYALSGIAGAAVFAGFNLDSPAQVIGASGAVAGMVGAVCRLSLRPGVAGEAMPFRSRGAVFGFIAIWLVFNYVFGVLPASLLGVEGGGIAWETHLGGFVFGFLVFPWFEGRGLPPRPFEFRPPSST